MGIGGGIGSGGKSSDLDSKEDSDKNSRLNIEIEFISQGAIPLFKVNEYTGEEQDLNTPIVQGSVKGVSHEVIKGKTEKLDIHDERTIMAAMDHFISIMRSQKKAGIPVSFGYTKLTEEEIGRIMDDATSTATSTNTTSTATSTSTTTSVSR